MEKSSQPFEIYEQFLNSNPYAQLKVKNSIVVDIGGGVGDTAILFRLNGAEKVYAFEPDPKRFDTGKENININKIRDIFFIKKEVNSLDDVNRYVRVKRLVLKSDCEGAEHIIFKNSTKESFKRYDEIIMEFHGGYLDIKKILEDEGFLVTYSFSPYYSADFNGILYARRR